MFFILCNTNSNEKTLILCNPICFTKKIKNGEFILKNLNASSSTSNKTMITTSEIIMFVHVNTITYHGKTYYLNNSMSVIDVDFFTQMVHWVENDNSVKITNAKEYISTEGGQKIFTFETIQQNVKSTTKRYLVLGGIIAGGLLSIIGLSYLGARFVKNFKNKQLEKVKGITEEIRESSLFDSLLDDVKKNVTNEKILKIEENLVRVREQLPYYSDEEQFIEALQRNKGRTYEGAVKAFGAFFEASKNFTEPIEIPDYDFDNMVTTIEEMLNVIYNDNVDFNPDDISAIMEKLYESGFLSDNQVDRYKYLQTSGAFENEGVEIQTLFGDLVGAIDTINTFIETGDLNRGIITLDNPDMLDYYNQNIKSPILRTVQVNREDTRLSVETKEVENVMDELNITGEQIEEKIEEQIEEYAEKDVRDVLSMLKP